MVGMKQMEVFRTKIVNQNSVIPAEIDLNEVLQTRIASNSPSPVDNSQFFFRFQSRASRGVPQRRVGWLLFLHAATTMDSQVRWYPQIIQD